jgi:hypothetical protein
LSFEGIGCGVWGVGSRQQAREKGTADLGTADLGIEL